MYLTPQIIRKGETAFTVFQADPNVEQIAIAVCSFLNSEGGEIYIGVDKSGTILGLFDADTVKKELQLYLLEKIIPEAPFIIHKGEYDGQNILRLVVQKGSKVPYVYRNLIYYRADTKNRKATPSYITKLVKARVKADLTWERQHVLNYGIEDLDREQIKRVMELSWLHQKSSKDFSEVQDFLSYFGLFKNGFLTNAAVLLFGYQPVLSMPQCRVHVSFTAFNRQSAATYELEKSILNTFNEIEALLSQRINYRFLSDIGIVGANNEVGLFLKNLMNLIVLIILQRSYEITKEYLQLNFHQDHFLFSIPGNIKLKKKEYRSGILPFQNNDIAQILYLRNNILNEDHFWTNCLKRSTFSSWHPEYKQSIKCTSVRLTYKDVVQNYGLPHIHRKSTKEETSSISSMKGTFSTLPKDMYNFRFDKVENKPWFVLKEKSNFKAIKGTGNSSKEAFHLENNLERDILLKLINLISIDSGKTIDYYATKLNISKPSVKQYLAKIKKLKLAHIVKDDKKYFIHDQLK